MADLVGVNEKGLRVGETHHRAKLTDHDIDLIRELHDPTYDDAGNVIAPGLSYNVLAEKFCCSKSTIRDIVKCRRRFQFVSHWKQARKKVADAV